MFLKDICFMVRLEIKNTHPRKILRGPTWGYSCSAKLTDDLGNSYRFMEMPSPYRHFDYQQPEFSIGPEESGNDFLVFEGIAAKAQKVILELPAQHVGGKGAIRIEIPRASFRKL